jgi:hypothetical protein
MTAVARTEIVVDVPRALAFERFVDFANWHLWMPSEFRPVSGPSRGLRSGDVFKVAIGDSGRVKLQLSVVRVIEHSEICWRGGSRLFIQGEHCFRFVDGEASASGTSRTIIRSEETLGGLLTLGPVGARVAQGAKQSADGLLARFADYLRSHSRAETAELPSCR